MSNRLCLINDVFSVEMQEDKKEVVIYDAECISLYRLDYRELGNLIHELEAIRRQMVLMPLPPEDLADDPNLYTTGGDY